MHCQLLPAAHHALHLPARRRHRLLHGPRPQSRESRHNSPTAVLGPQAKLSERSRGSGRAPRFCLAVRVHQKQTVMHWQPHKTRPFLQIVVASPNLVTQARGAGPAVPELLLHVL